MAYKGGNNGLHGAKLGHPYGAPIFVLSQQTVSGTASYTVKGAPRFKFRVIDVQCVATAAGGAADTVTVKNGSDAITDAIDLNDSDKVISRAATIDDAFRDIDTTQSLVVATASDAVADVYIYCVRI